MKFTNIEQVWTALDQGETIYWSNTAYKLTIEPSFNDYRMSQGLAPHFSNRDGACLRVTCISNYFGSLLDENELSQLFLKKD